MLRLSIAAALLAYTVNAECPNACSGHGDCGSKDQCVCYYGFFGGDCSLRICPVGSAFVDIPRGDLNHDGIVGPADSGDLSSGYSKVQWSRYKQFELWPTAVLIDETQSPKLTAGNDDLDPDHPDTNIVGGWAAQGGEAHFQMECSGKGHCDRQLGACRCFDGYTGAACQRTTCPNDCSGHGICRTISEIAWRGYNNRFVDSVAGQNTYTGVTSPFEYRLWDGSQNSACICDEGYGGMDCSLRQCPRGDDPLTNAKATCGGECTNEVQSFSVRGNSLPEGLGDTDFYALYFTDFSGVEYVTKKFPVYSNPAGFGSIEEMNAINEKAVKDALESLPNKVAGLVSVSATTFTGEVNGIDVTYGAGGDAFEKHYRLSISFTSKSGNIPDMRLKLVATTGPALTDVGYFHPSQPVHIFSFDLDTANPNTLSFTVYPNDLTLFGNPSYWKSSVDATFSVGAADPLSDSMNKVNAAINDAFQSIPAIRLFGSQYNNWPDEQFLCNLWIDDGTAVTPAEPAELSAPHDPGKTYKVACVLSFPDKLFGGNKVEVSANGQQTVMQALNDVIDGNTEAAICSNRGICDYSSGLCKCFAGYIGASCDTQSALAQ